MLNTYSGWCDQPFKYGPPRELLRRSVSLTMMPRFFAANAVIARLMVAPSAAQYLRAWDTAIVVVGVNVPVPEALLFVDV